MCNKFTWGRTERWITHKAPFLPYPEVVTSSTSGSLLFENSSDRKAGSPIETFPQGPIFSKLSHTCKFKSWELCTDTVLKVKSKKINKTTPEWTLYLINFSLIIIKTNISKAEKHNWCLIKIFVIPQIHKMWLGRKLVLHFHTLPVHQDHGYQKHQTPSSHLKLKLQLRLINSWSNNNII